MHAIRIQFPVVGCLLLLIQACAVAPPVDESTQQQQQQQPAAQKPMAELTLHLPDQTPVCSAPIDSKVDRTFLDKGFSALVEGDHREAMNYFRRYQRLESAPGVDWEAGIAVAYDKMMPDSPYYNWRAARESYLRLMRQPPPKEVKLHKQIVLMRDALAILSDLHLQIDELQNETDDLSERLEKREEALRRLRELTLGQ